MIVTTKQIKQKKQNAKGFPTEYSCNVLEPGLVSYEDSGQGIAMLPKETILKLLPTFIGKPVVARKHIDVRPEDFEDVAVGYITKAWYDDYANWAYFSFLLIDDQAKKDVANGYSVSCAYDQIVTDASGGSWHAIDFDETILDGVGNHLALVTSPRYEGCKIQSTMMLVNSKKAKITEGEGRKNSTVVLTIVVNSSRAEKFSQKMYDKYGSDYEKKMTPDEERTMRTIEKEENSKKNTVVLKVSNETYKGWKIKKNDEGIYQAIDDVSGSPRYGSRKLEDVKAWIDRSSGGNKNASPEDSSGAIYKEYIKRWKADGRDVAEALKTRFGLTKAEAKIVMDKYDNAKSVVTVRVANSDKRVNTVILKVVNVGRKIDIMIDGKYEATTTQSDTCKEAVERYIEKYKPEGKVTASFQK